MDEILIRDQTPSKHLAPSVIPFLKHAYIPITKTFKTIFITRAVFITMGYKHTFSDSLITKKFYMKWIQNLALMPVVAQQNSDNMHIVSTRVPSVQKFLECLQ